MAQADSGQTPPKPQVRPGEAAGEAVVVGQLAMNADGVVSTWDQGMQRLSGLDAEEAVGRILPLPLLGRAYPPLADFLRRNDESGARRAFGLRSFLRFLANDHWVARGKMATADGGSLAVTEMAWRHGESGAVLETIFATADNPASATPPDGALHSLKILAEHVPAGVALIQDGLLKMVNHTFCSMFGYTHPSELLDKPSSLLLVEGDRMRHRQMLESLDKNPKDSLTFRWTGIDKNGRKFWFEGKPAPIDWDGRPATLSVVMDITEFKQREELIEKESLELRQENLRLKTSIDYRVRLGNIIGRSRKMQEVFESILRAASSDFGIVIYGETGTGKELVAKAVHEMSPRGEGPFVAVNCGAIPEDLFEAEFFGHRKGSFTGAHADKEGYLDQARGGTLFLDEVAEISYSSQVKLLRALESGEYTAIGSPKSRQSDFRVVSATNRDLERMVQKGDFRRDLFYRIHVIPIALPPLRERKEDIPFLVEFFLEDKLGSDKKMASYEMAKLLGYEWPGNVRELRNTLERYIAFGNLDFMPAGGEHTLVPEDCLEATENSDLRTVLMRAEKQIIMRSLDKYQWNRSHTAAALGLPRKTLFRKMRKLGISQGRDED